MRKRPCLLILLSLLLLSACSPGAGKSADKPEETIKPAATDPEGMVTEGPGKFAGDRYDEAKVQAELKKWPKNMTADEVYNRLVWLMAEDYKPVIKEAKEYKPSFSLSKLGDFDPNRQQNSEGKKQEKNKRKNIVILIDSSGSMAGKVSGNTKMEEAKKAVKEFAGSLEGDIRIAIRAYGHKGTNREKDKKLSCASTEELYPLSAYQKERFNQVIDSLKPSGWTPLAAAIRGAGEDLASAHPEDENIVYVVSDGIESCGGDPVKEAKALH
ncbi:MAG: VWA domain-containing protein, partial [Planifilum fulgidum]